MRLSRDTLLGLLAVIIAGAYYAESTRIQHSMLADAVGADGVPRMLAMAMMLVGLLLAARGLLRPLPAKDGDLPLAAHLRAAGLLAIVVGYTLLLPVAGYPIAVAALIAAVALYADARPSLALAAAAAGGAALFWLMFRWVLGISMPAGVLAWG